MQALIGNTLVKQLRPAEKPFEIRDTRLKGFLLRVQPTGVMSFYVEYGRGKRASLGKADAISVETARQRARQIVGQAYQGADPMEAMRRAKAATFGEFLDKVYRPWAEANIKTAGPTMARLNHEFPDFSNKKLAEITPWIVEKWRAGRLKAGTKPSTVNRTINDLKSALSKAVAWGQIEVNPIAGVKHSRVDRAGVVRYLDDDEERRLRQALDDREERIRAERDAANRWREARDYPLLPDLRAVAFVDHLKPLVVLSLATGMRRGELFGLKWIAVDLVARRITVHGATAKSGNTRHLPLNSEAAAALEGWREQTDGKGLVFPGRDGAELDNCRKSWAGVLRAAGIANFRWHDMRHHFASRLVMAGVDLNTVRELLGHSSFELTQRYAHLSPEHKAAAVERLVR